MKSAGYSGTHLYKKLGFKESFIVQLINPPANYFALFTELPENINFQPDPNTLKDCIHFFTKEAEELDDQLKVLPHQIKQNGMIWVSWPKKSSKVPTDVTEDIIRDCALRNGLVDIKVCAVNQIWSALKLVIPVKDRK